MSWDLVALQRLLTVEFIAKRYLNAPAIWLRPQSLNPDTKDAVADTSTLNTDIQKWAVQGEERNLGVRLIDYVELQIRAPDETFQKQLFAAFEHLHVDARAAYGLRLAPVSGIIFKADQVDKWRELWPKGHRNKLDAWVETRIACSIVPTTKSGKPPMWAHSTPLPGSILPNSAGMADLVMWRPKGKLAATNGLDGLEDLERRMLAPTSMESICRSIAFATLAYWIVVYLEGLSDWDTILTRRLGGWIARLVVEGRAINEQGKSLEGVCWAPIDDHAHAMTLLEFLYKLGATKELEHAYLLAERDLQRNPMAPVPSWPSIEELFGVPARIGIRRAFQAGLDIAVIERLSEQYVLDFSTHLYNDRDALRKGNTFEHEHERLMRRHANDLIRIGSKRENSFKIYAASTLRTDVARTDLFPGEEEGAILRYSPVHGLVRAEDSHPDEFKILNIYRGFVIKPASMVDQGIMKLALTQLDRMLGYLTQDNSAQMLWLKKWIAWIIQHPEQKQQVCPIIIGGQGIGKSIFGIDFLAALFGELASMTAAKAFENQFSITPFVGRLITFIDEVRLESISAINEIKRIIRSIRVSGEFKNRDRVMHNIYSRVLMATNQPDIGLTPEDAADRAFFFVMGYTADNRKQSDWEFKQWIASLKPFYVDFLKNLASVSFKQHLMHYFTHLECARAELEDLTHSSRADENIIKATMSDARRIARTMVADARIFKGWDITAWFTTANLHEAIQRVENNRFTKISAERVMEEFERAGVLETVRGDIHKFKYGYAKILQVMGDFHDLPIINNHDFRPGDYDINPIRSGENPPKWRGKEETTKASQGRYQDPDDRGWEPDE
jgi:hypothetical protein